jgi:hypothetical protein
VEAKICSNLTGREWSEEGRFDDPLIRIILAAMWTMCGEWQEAQVDFLAANKLDPSIKWARILADMDRPPENLMIVLGGTGQEPEWSPSLEANPFRGFRGIKFNPQGVRSALVMKDAGSKTYPLEITPDSSNWYRRHFIRDNEIQDIIQDSTYAQKAAASALKGTAVTLAGISTGILIAAGGIALGGGIIVLGLYVESGELAAMGILPIIGGCTWGYDVAKKSYKYSVRESKKDLDVSRIYRFVRFLPEYAWVGWSMEKIKEPIIIHKKGKPLLSSNASSAKAAVNIVSVGFFPDTINVQEVEKARNSFGRAPAGSR